MKPIKQLKIFSLALILQLTACAPKTLPGTEAIEHYDAKTTAKHINAAKHLSTWQITGAVAAKTKNKSWTASLDWKQQSLNRYRLRLYGPLGGGSVLVEKNGRIITYQDGQKKIKTTDIDQLLYKETGVRVPLHNLYYWVRGVKAPGAIQSTEYDAKGHLIILKQGGYTIRYEGYQTVKGRDLPTKLRVTGSRGSLKLVIKHWEIH
ncbi:MAG: lipoprotein insertase outer membrane protein LolB [Legionella sp.]|nr:lipoprotein insertase outer membrane protein LolB [Legionella sp.]